MANMNPPKEHLIPGYHKLTKEENSAGGKKAMENQKKRKQLRELLEYALFNGEETDNNAVNITKALIEQALSGNTKAYEIIRDTLGETVTNKISIEETPKIIDDINE